MSIYVSSMLYQFVHSPIEEHLDWFQSLAVLKKAAPNISYFLNGLSSLKIKYIVNQLTSNMHPNQTEEAPSFSYFMLSIYINCTVVNN